MNGFQLKYIVVRGAIGFLTKYFLTIAPVAVVDK